MLVNLLRGNIIRNIPAFYPKRFISWFMLEKPVAASAFLLLHLKIGNQTR
jgi:hypothetical protein